MTEVLKDSVNDWMSEAEKVGERGGWESWRKK